MTDSGALQLLGKYHPCSTRDVREQLPDSQLNQIELRKPIQSFMAAEEASPDVLEKLRIVSLAAMDLRKADGGIKLSAISGGRVGLGSQQDIVRPITCFLMSPNS